MSQASQPIGNDGAIYQATVQLVNSLVGPALSTFEFSGSHHDNTSISLDKDGSTRTGSAAQSRFNEATAKKRGLIEYALSILASRLRSPVPSDAAEALSWAQHRVKLKRTFDASSYSSTFTYLTILCLTFPNILNFHVVCLTLF